MFEAKKAAVGMRGVHLDLKGLPPTAQRLLEMPEILAAARYNCVLVEWEDTFPWTFDRSIRCQTAYSEATVKKFLDRSEKLGIEVIPLVQSFGHLENVLGRKKYAALREKKKVVSDLCPQHPASLPLVQAMVRDILRLHGGRSRYLHLGGDEVWTLGSCPKCQEVVKTQGKAELYLRHITPVLEQVRAAGAMPILWDDMMRGWPDEMLRGFAGQAALMAWSYGADPFAWLKAEVMERFVKAGIEVWGAGAYKGADGPNADLPKLSTRAANMQVWAKAAKRYKLKGVVATGWSRYNTYMTPCESMEASWDALVMAGAILWDGSAGPELEAQAQAMLRTGALKHLAGERFWACREAAGELAAGWAETMRLVDQARQFPHLAGVKERLSPAAWEGFKSNWKKNGKRLKHGARLWRQAHAGRVPMVWMAEYLRSRTWMPELLQAGLG